MKDRGKPVIVDTNGVVAALLTSNDGSPVARIFGGMLLLGDATMQGRVLLPQAFVAE